MLYCRYMSVCSCDIPSNHLLEYIKGGARMSTTVKSLACRIVAGPCERDLFHAFSRACSEPMLRPYPHFTVEIEGDDVFSGADVRLRIVGLVYEDDLGESFCLSAESNVHQLYPLSAQELFRKGKVRVSVDNTKTQHYNPWTRKGVLHLEFALSE